MKTQEQEIVEDIRRVARGLGLKTGDQLSRSEYLNNGARFSMYQIYDGGMTWSHYCQKAGFEPKAAESVPDEIYFKRLLEAKRILGRLPKTAERKKYHLNFSKRRWPTLEDFIRTAVSRGIVEPPISKTKEDERVGKDEEPPEKKYHLKKLSSDISRPIPPIPEKTRRKKWERTGVEGFPYAPQDESGVIALFSILCGQGIIPWQIIDLNSGKGIDAVCYDDQQHQELRVELKHTLSRSNWNHPFDSFDYLVCWENRWRDFPKPVIELKDLIKK